MFDSPFMMLPGITPQEYSYLQSATTGFTELQLKRFLMIYSSKRRNPDDMVLYCILGFFVPGLPRFLLNQIGMGILYFFTYGLCGIGTIIDLVNHKNLAFEYNQRMVFESLQMIKMGTILFLESYAPLNYQEDYDNSGLIVGEADQEIHSALVALDCTEEIIDEAIVHNCNLIITHHPIVFKGLKKLTGKTYIERVVIKAIKHNIALYAIHTNLDHVHNGDLKAKNAFIEKTCNLLSGGSGHAEGYGTFNGNEQSNAFVGEKGIQHQEQEIRIETIFRSQDERKILVALLENHPYEEVAYDIYALENKLENVGAGMVGWLENGMEATEFLSYLKERMNVQVIRYTRPGLKKIRRVAVCGGSGSFLLSNAIAANADVFITGDFKYHEFFDADKKLMIADIGHFESEQFTSNLLTGIIREQFPEFSVRLTEHNTNPVGLFLQNMDKPGFKSLVMAEKHLKS
eukprot:gene11465-14047_t